MTRFDNFYEELPAEDNKTEEQPQDEPRDVRSHILSAEELEAWKNGTDEGPVLRRAADVQKEEEDANDKDGDETPAEEDDSTTEEELNAPNPFANAVADPGVFVPRDYSFEVSVFDQDGKNPKTIKITSIEQWDELLETDPNLGNGAAVLRAQRFSSRMENGIERDKEAYEAKKQAFDQAKELSEQQNKEVSQWDAELDYLSGKGKLPPITKELKEANWNDPEVAAQAPVKARIDLMKYMDKESKARVKLGLPRFSSVLDAFNSFMLDETEANKIVARNQAAAARKAAGARIGGSQPAQATSTPKGIAVGRVNPGGLRDMGVRF